MKNSIRKDNDAPLRKQMQLWLIEQQSISQTVKNCTEYIKNVILEKCQGQPNKISPILKLPYFKGNFELDVHEFLPKLGLLTVDYYIYQVNNIRQYNTAIYYNDLEQASSEADYESKKLIIVSCLCQGQLISDFAENIQHEITHLYQYDQGMQKRVNLYDELIKLAQSTDKTKMLIGWCGYLTFKHEQDAFVHQYYAALENNKFKGSFDESLKLCQHYLGLINMFKDLKTSPNLNDKRNLLKNIGYDLLSFERRIHHGIKRFKRKLFNAYCRYEYESQSVLNEVLDKIDLEKYNLLIEMEDYFKY